MNEKDYSVNTNTWFTPSHDSSHAHALETTTQEHVYWVSYVVFNIEVQQDVCDISAGFPLVA